MPLRDALYLALKTATGELGEIKKKGGGEKKKIVSVKSAQTKTPTDPELTRA